MAQAPFPTDLWLIAAKHLSNAFSATSRWLETYEPPGEARSGEFSIAIFPEPPPKPPTDSDPDAD